MNPATTHGAFSWPELLTRDADAASRFYADVFGWDIEVMEMDMGPYILGKVGKQPVAGIMNIPSPDVPTSWTFYVTVKDVDASAEKATGLGATVIVEPQDISEVGRFTGILDPQGAYLAMISYGYEPMEGPQLDFKDFSEVHGQFSWYELRTSSVDDAVDFYSELFGWTIEKDNTGAGPYNVVRVGQTMIGGIIAPPQQDGVPPHWSAYVTVDDVEETAQKIRKKGAVVMVQPTPVEGVGTIMTFSDPHGAVLTAVSYE